MIGIGALVLVLAACGSNLSPDEVAGTDTGDTQVSADGSLVIGTDPGTGTGTGADSGSGSGTVAPGTDPGSTGGTGTGSGTTDPGAGTDDGAGAPAPGEGASEPPVEGPTEAECAGFANQTGVTDDTITIGNASDVSGPVPGLFETAQEGTKAFVAYFNATVPAGICGRRLELKTYDSRTDAAADQQAYAAACDEVFAMVGSTSAFDLGGAQTAEECGLPDLRAGAVTFERNACTTCFGVQAVNTKFFENAVPDFVKAEYGDAGQRSAFFFSDAGAAAQNAQAQVNAMEKRGLKFPVVQGIGVDEFNYTSYVQQMKDNDIEVVFFTTSYQFSVRLRQAMAQQGFEPKLYLRDPTDYNPQYVSQGGGDVDGTVVYTNFVPFEEAGSNPEMTNYISYLNQVKPGAAPQFFGVFAWSAARLFVTLAAKLGGKLTRESLIAETRKVEDWTGEGLHAPQPVGSKGTGECWRFIQLSGGTWKPIGGTDYSCTGLSSTS